MTLIQILFLVVLFLAVFGGVVLAARLLSARNGWAFHRRYW